MFLLSLISLALGQNIAEIDYSVQVGTAPKPAIVATQPALPSAQAYPDANTVRMPMASHHREVMGSATRQPQASYPGGRSAMRYSRGLDVYRYFQQRDWSARNDRFYLHAPMTQYFTFSAPRAMGGGGFTRSPQLFRFAAPLSTHHRAAIEISGGGFVRSAGFAFERSSRLTMNGPWPERRALGLQFAGGGGFSRAAGLIVSPRLSRSSFFTKAMAPRLRTLDVIAATQRRH
jgi:hypothetical protein